MSGLNDDEASLFSILNEIQWREFEKFIAEFWQRQGWETQLTSHNDKGVDIIAEQHIPVKIRAHIQAKASAIGGPELKQYAGLPHHDNTDIGVLVSSGSLTSQAKSEKKNFDLKVIDGKSLARLVNEVGAQDILLNAAGKDSTETIEGIGEIRSEELAQVGIHTVDDLANADPKKIAEQTTLSEAQTRRWTNHATYLRGEPTSNIDRIGEKRAEKLAKADIHTVGDLATANPKEIAEKTTLSESFLETLVERADRRTKKDIKVVKGIGEKRAEKLAKAGIHTVGDLAIADPEEIVDHIDLSESKVKDLIERA